MDIKVNKEQFNKELENNEILIADFFATWCGPCQMFGPVFEKASQEIKDKKIKLVKIDVDEENNLALENNVSSVPTVVAFKNGKEVKRFLGFKPLDQLKDFINSI